MGCAASQNTKQQSAGKLTLTYWPLHGLGAAPRMALHFAGVEFDDVLVGGADKWFGEQSKAIGAEKNALVNLPYLTTPEGEVIVQSQAVLRHIGRTQQLYGATAKDAARVDRIIEILIELRNVMRKPSAVLAPFSAGRRYHPVCAPLLFHVSHANSGQLPCFSFARQVTEKVKHPRRVQLHCSHWATRSHRTRPGEPRFFLLCCSANLPRLVSQPWVCRSSFGHPPTARSTRPRRLPR